MKQNQYKIKEKIYLRQILRPHTSSGKAAFFFRQNLTFLFSLSFLLFCSSEKWRIYYYYYYLIFFSFFNLIIFVCLFVYLFVIFFWAITKRVLKSE